MSRRKQRSAFDQVSEFDRGRIVAYRDCGLSFREIGSRVGRNQTTYLRVPFDSVYSSGLSARRPLLGLPLTQNHRRLRRQWCDERRMWVAEWNEVIFTDESRICLQHHDGRIRVWRHREERMLNSCVMHRHTGPVPGIMIELLPWPARSPDLSPIENMWCMVVQRLTQITPPAATCGSCLVCCAPRTSLFESMPRRVAAVISNNGGYSSY
ncbi:transposable element Tcb1 transposase [Trichonephila clavipes]|nr:transposable element Tcb1 transposase [Trichonephila clavipes]